MEVGHVNKKPVKRVVPEKIAEVGQWKAAKAEDKIVGEAVNKEDQAINEDGKAVDEVLKAGISIEGAKTN